MDEERNKRSREHRLITVRGVRGNTRQMEVRREAIPLAARAEGGGGGGFEGYANTFWLVDAWGTAVADGAFTKTLQERSDQISVLWQHWPDWPIGKPTALAQDETGLFTEAAISDTTQGRDAMTLLRDGVPLGLSIGFLTMRERPATADDPLRLGELTPKWALNNPDNIWVIEEIKLFEYSVVTFPANEESFPTTINAAPAGKLASHLLEDLRKGSVAEPDRILAAQIAAAYAAAPDPEGAPRTAPVARRGRDLEFDLLMAARDFAALGVAV